MGWASKKFASVAWRSNSAFQWLYVQCIFFNGLDVKDSPSATIGSTRRERGPRPRPRPRRRAPPWSRSRRGEEGGYVCELRKGAAHHQNPRGGISEAGSPRPDLRGRPAHLGHNDGARLAAGQTKQWSPSRPCRLEVGANLCPGGGPPRVPRRRASAATACAWEEGLCRHRVRLVGGRRATVCAWEKGRRRRRVRPGVRRSRSLHRPGIRRSGWRRWWGPTGMQSSARISSR
jgi:hypothetical protein